MFTEAFAKLEKVRCEFSKESDELLLEAKAALLDGVNEYFTSVRKVFRWSLLAENAVNTYGSLIEQGNTTETDTQRKHLIEALKKGVRVLKNATNELESSSVNFNYAHGILTSLFVRFRQESEVNKEVCKEKVRDVIAVNINDQIKDELSIIHAMNVQTHILHTFVTIDVTNIAGDTLAFELLKRCNEFRKRHAPNGN